MLCELSKALLLLEERLTEEGSDDEGMRMDLRIKQVQFDRA